MCARAQFVPSSLSSAQVLRANCFLPSHCVCARLIFMCMIASFHPPIPNLTSCAHVLPPHMSTCDLPLSLSLSLSLSMRCCCACWPPNLVPSLSPDTCVRVVTHHSDSSDEGIPLLALMHSCPITHYQGHPVLLCPRPHELIPLDLIHSRPSPSYIHVPRPHVPRPRTPMPLVLITSLAPIHSYPSLSFTHTPRSHTLMPW